MRVVLDTNVLVSGLLRPFGPPGRILRLLAAGELVPCYDSRVLLEYREVLGRERFAFHPARVEALMAQVAAGGVRVHGVAPLEVPLPDADDEVFLEVALAGAAEAVVTGNSRHFPRRARAGVTVLTPAELVDRWT